MRKLILSALSMILTAGLVLAAQVTLVSFDGKVLKVKEGDVEKSYDVDDKTVFKATTKDGDKDIPLEKATKALEKGGGKAKLDITVDGKKVTEVKFKMGGKAK